MDATGRIIGEIYRFSALIVSIHPIAFVLQRSRFLQILSKPVGSAMTQVNGIPVRRAAPQPPRTFDTACRKTLRNFLFTNYSHLQYNQDSSQPQRQTVAASRKPIDSLPPCPDA
jgi:hypothetical protein